MENCLVTTLRQAAANDNLPILDSIVINVVKTEEERLPEQKYLEFKLVGGTSVTFTVLDGSNKIALSESLMENNPRNTITVSSSNAFKIYFVNDNYKVKVSSKNNIQVFRNYIGISATKRTYIEPIYNGMSGLYNLGTFINSSSSLPFDIEILKDSASSLVALMSSYSPNCYGDIASLGSCILLETLRLTGTSCSGNVEEIAQKQVDNGRTSGTLTVYAAKSNIKYNGSSIANYVTITFNENGYVIS